MIDTWLKSSDARALSLMCENYNNVLGPAKGQAAVIADKQANPPIEAQPAKGNPEQYYACIRTETEIDVAEAITVITQDEGSEVLGVWA